MRTKRLGALAATAVAAVTLAACTGVGPANIRGATEALPAEQAVLKLTAPGLHEAATRRALYLDNSEREEYVLYQGKGGAQAEILLVDASLYAGGPRGGDTYTLEFDRSTRDTVLLWNMSKAAKPLFAESFPHKGDLTYYLQPFKRQDTGQSCFGFHSEFNLDAFAYRHNPYDSQLFGYYCAPAGNGLDATAMASIVDGLKLVGTTVRATTGAAGQQFRQLKQDPILFAKVTQGDPAGQTGMARFPLLLARQYGPDPGGSPENR